MSSRWPGDFLLDELWLRTRRLAIQRLEVSHFDVQQPEYREFMNSQRELGDELVTTVLRPILGEVDFALLFSERLFGIACPQFHRRLPYTLAFGYELGHCCSLLQAEENCQVHELANLCAIFNLGISLFDLLYDQRPELGDAFSELFDSTTLECLYTDAAKVSDLELKLESVKVPEIRLVLRTVVGFFDGVHRHYSAGAKRSNNLGTLLRQSYLAEMHSVLAPASPIDLTEDCIVKVAQTKSVLPFEIFHELVRAGEESEQALKVDLLIADIAEIFWRIDDLMDLVLDFQSGGVNSLLIRHNSKMDLSTKNSGAAMMLTKLLEGGDLEVMSDNIVASLFRLSEGLSYEGFRPEVTERLLLIVKSYLKDWIR